MTYTYIKEDNRGGRYMKEKFIGKIVKAEFGVFDGRRTIIGLQLTFEFDSAGFVSDGGKHVVNISDEVKWDSDKQKIEAIQNAIKHVSNVLEEAKVSYVSELIGKAVEIEIEDQVFKSFRILTKNT